MHDELFQTLADPTRRKIVEVLCRGEQQVNDIVRAVEIHQSGVSRHLGILHDAGFVQARRDGARRLYSLCPGPFRELETWVAQYRNAWEARLDRLGEALNRSTKPRFNKRKERSP